jgi:membrane-associated phospholipid phosphatase
LFVGGNLEMDTKKIANLISVFGHPLLTGPLFTTIALFYYEDPSKALWISALIFGGVFIPISIKMYRGAKSGEYTNFDVSEQRQRQSWYIWATGLFFMLYVVLWVTGQSHGLKAVVQLTLLLMITAQLVNFFIKSSLHMSLNVFMMFLIFPISVVAGVLFCCFIFLVGWSRITLGRHTVKEVLTGALIGLIFGLASM